MSATTRVGVFDHATQTANTWVHDLAREFGTDDRQFAYRVLRAWLHTLRDRLTVEATAHFAAQLPELLRGIYYEGWNPSKVPERYDAEAYVLRFAREANIANRDVPKAAAVGTTVLSRHLAGGQVDKALDQLPADMRSLLQGRRASEADPPR